MCDERYFSSQNKLVKSVITVNGNKENLLAIIKKRLILMGKQLKMTFKQALTKIIVTKNQLLILTIMIPFYKLKLIIIVTSKDTQEHQNKDNIKKKYRPARKVKMHHRMKRKNLKRSPRTTKTHHQNVKGYI